MTDKTVLEEVHGTIIGVLQRKNRYVFNLMMKQLVKF